MANVTPTETEMANGDRLITWASAAAADTPTASAEVKFDHEAVFQPGGTFDSATVVLQGTLDGTNYATLKDPANSDVSKTAAAVVGVRDQARKYKPSWSGGGGSQSLTLTLLIRKRR